MGIYGIIERIRERPGLYLADRKITLLKAFLDDYRACEIDNADYDTSSGLLFPLDFSNLSDFISMKLNIYSAQDWCGMLLGFFRRDDIAYEAFFKFFDMFKDIRMSEGWRAELSKINILHNDSMNYGYREDSLNVRKPMYENPISVCIVGMTGDNGYLLLVETETEIISGGIFFKSLEDTLERSAQLFGTIKNWIPMDNRKNIDTMKDIDINGVGRGDSDSDTDGRVDNIKFNKPLRI